MHLCLTCGKLVKLVPHIISGRMMLLELNPPAPAAPNVTLSIDPHRGVLAAVVGAEAAQLARERGGTAALDHHASCRNPKLRRLRSRRP